MLDKHKAIGARLEEALQQRQLNNIDLARQQKVTVQAVGGWIKTGSIARERIAGICKFLQINPAWLLTGIVDSPVDQAAATLGIPVVGNTQGGPDHQWVEMGYPAGFGDEYVSMISKDSHAYALYVRGSSMSPRFREGDVILVEPSMVAEPGDDVVVRTTDGQVMVKELVSSRNDQVILSSIAEDHDRIVLPFSKVEFIHPVGATVPPRSIFKRKAV